MIGGDIRVQNQNGDRSLSQVTSDRLSLCNLQRIIQVFIKVVHPSINTAVEQVL